MKEFKLTANDENLMEVTEFVENELRANGFSEKSIMQTNIVIEEIFVNISHYAYSPEDGDAIVKCKVEDDRAEICFIDSGKKYNPLVKEDPDITLGAEERQIGGLGIYMSKNLTDGMEYSYKDGQNILTVYKNK